VRRTRWAVALAAALVLALPGAALGAGQSATTAQTLSVATTTSLTGVPASLSYGSGLSGTMRSAPVQTASVAATTDNPAGVRLTVAFSNLTSGSDSIAATANRILLSETLPTSECVGAENTPWDGGSGKAYPGPAGSDWELCERSSAGSVAFPGTGVTWTPKISVPAGQAPGAYTGTVTWKATEL